MNLKHRVKLVLEPYLIEIESKNLIDLFHHIIDSTPEYMLSLPASTSGKYHHIEERGECGFVWHMVKSFLVAKHSVRRYAHLNDYDIEVVKLAAMLHDLPYRAKWDIRESKYHTDKLHPFKNAIYLMDTKRYGVIDIPIEYIGAVFFHMGRWANYSHTLARVLSDKMWPLMVEPVSRQIIAAVEEADYYSTRTDLIVDIISSERDRIETLLFMEDDV